MTINNVTNKKAITQSSTDSVNNNT